MNLTSAVIGVLALGFGLFTLVLRLSNPQKLGKLQPMKEKLGETAGNVVHAVFYIALPSFFGLLCLFLAAKGTSILG